MDLTQRRCPAPIQAGLGTEDPTACDPIGLPKADHAHPQCGQPLRQQAQIPAGDVAPGTMTQQQDCRRIVRLINDQFARTIGGFHSQRHRPIVTPPGSRQAQSARLGDPAPWSRPDATGRSVTC